MEKITFVRQQYNSPNGQFVAITNDFTDTYVTNNIFQHQSLRRVITQSDILFCAKDLAIPAWGYERTDTSRWWNSTVFTGQTNHTGPGVIVPPIKITLDRRGSVAETYDQYPNSPFVFAPKWSSIDNSTNVYLYPEGPTFQGADQLSVHFRLETPGLSERAIDWKIPASLGETVVLQTSTNLLDWVFAAAATNYTGSLTWYHFPSDQLKFFRVVPQ